MQEIEERGGTRLCENAPASRRTAGHSRSASIRRPHGRTGLRFEVPSGELFHRLDRQPHRYALACRHGVCPH